MRAWHTILGNIRGVVHHHGNIIKLFDTLPLKSDDVGRVSFVHVAFQDIVVLLSFCKIILIGLSSMLKNRVDFYATKGIRHHIVTPFDVC